VIAYALNGFGAALEDAQANGFVASYKDNAATKMGVLHAAYGRAAFIQLLDSNSPAMDVQASELWYLLSWRHSLRNDADGHFITLLPLQSRR
jgi:hypothetical protein